MMEQCKEKLSIAMFGQKRIPSREGGVEIVVEELCTRMVAQGHNVTCYNRGGHHVSGSEYDSKRLKEYKGIKLKTVPTIEKKGLAAVSSSFFAALCCAFGKYDVVHIHAEGPAFFCWLPKLFHKRVIVTVHGIDWQREKWKSGFGSKFIHKGEKNAVKYADEIIVKYTYKTITTPATTVLVSYSVDASGKIRVDVHYNGVQGLPEFPVFGMRFIMPTLADKYLYKGLSGETYPDRKAGAQEGVYEIDDLSLTQYLVPQECGMRMDTEWLEITRHTALDNSRTDSSSQTLRIEKNDEKFAFSCLPYTASEIENALHHEELPPARRTVLCIYGAVRGVGGIDSWGTDVEEDYRISAETDKDYSFTIC